MSDNVFKVCVRGRIPELDGKTFSEVFPIFKEKFGNPIDVEIDHTDEIADFGNSLDVIVPVYNYDDKQWGLEKTILRGEWDDEVNINVEEIMNIKKEMQNFFPSISKVILSAFMWRTSVEEPVTFEDKNKLIWRK